MDRSQLEQIEARLLRERSRALRSLHRFREEVAAGAEAATVGAPAYRDYLADSATETREREKTFFFAEKEEHYLARIQDALRRLYTRPEEFGRCVTCAAEIPFPRLEALPHVRYCLACKLHEEEGA